MSIARRRDEWDRAANLLCMLANIHRKDGSPPFDVSKFHPLAVATQHSRIIKGSINDLKALIGGGKRGSI